MDEAHFEHAARIAEAEREDALSDARRKLLGKGQPDCKDCGDPIADARRKAFPAAIRCINCQGAFERVRAQFHPQR